MIPILICHCKELKERKTYLESYFKENKITNYKFFEEIDKNNLTESQLKMYKYNYTKFKNISNSEPRLLTPAEIAVTITHILMYKYIIENNIDIALIIEDDCIFKSEFKNLDKYLFQLKQENFDTCFISNSYGWTIDNYKTGPFSSEHTSNPSTYVYRMKAGRTADAYLISKNGANKLLENLKEPFCLPIDFEHNRIFTENLDFRNYWAEPSLTHPGSEDVYNSSMGRQDKIEIYRKCNGLNQNEPHFINDKKLRPFSIKRLENFIEKLNSSDNFTIVKYGDGEMTNMISNNEMDHNCDGNNYFNSLGIELIHSYIYFLRDPSTYICRWDHVYDVQEIIDKDYKCFFNDSLSEGKFLEYNILIHKLESNSFRQEQINFFKTIQNSKRKKYYISNKEMVNCLCPLLNIDIGIIIPDRNSYLHSENIYNTIFKEISEENSIILVSAGMFSKVLISKLSQQRPNNTYIDIGSTFDGLIKGSRDFNCHENYKKELLKVYSKNNNCINCNKKGSGNCSRCKSVNYCSKECQKEHWKVHKSNCKEFKTTYIEVPIQHKEQKKNNEYIIILDNKVLKDHMKNMIDLIISNMNKYNLDIIFIDTTILNSLLNIIDDYYIVNKAMSLTYIIKKEYHELYCKNVIKHDKEELTKFIKKNNLRCCSLKNSLFN